MTSHQTDASLAAKAFPAGPVAPNNPIFMLMIIGKFEPRSTNVMLFIHIRLINHEL